MPHQRLGSSERAQQRSDLQHPAACGSTVRRLATTARRPAVHRNAVRGGTGPDSTALPAPRRRTRQLRREHRRTPSAFRRRRLERTGAVPLHRLLSVTMGVPNVAETARYYADFGLTPATDGWFSTTDGGRQLHITYAPSRRLVELRVGVDDQDALYRIAAN